MAKKKGKMMKKVMMVANILLIAGGINWFLVTWFNFDLVTFISFGVNVIEQAIKTLVGVSAIAGLVKLFK